MAVTVDILDGSGGRKTKDGWELTRIATVTGLTGTSHAKIIAAVNAAIGAVGDIGASHPSHAAAKISEFSPEPLTTEDVKVRIVYKEEPEVDDPEYAEIEIGTSLGQTETNKDSAGELISVEYTYPEDYKLDPNKAIPDNNPYEQGGLLPKLVPESSIVYSRKESTSPGAKSRTYVGKVNSGGWSLDPTAAAKTWLCTAITGRSNDGGQTYQVTYTFQYRSDTWDETILFVNPDDGKPPKDLVQGTGQKKIQIYQTANFSGLSL